MPNIKSQKARVEQTKKETLRNKQVVSGLKTAIKKAETSQKGEEGESVRKKAVSAVAKAAGKGAMSKNTAARRISKLMKAEKAE